MPSGGSGNRGIAFDIVRLRARVAVLCVCCVATTTVRAWFGLEAPVATSRATGTIRPAHRTLLTTGYSATETDSTGSLGIKTGLEPGRGQILAVRADGDLGFAGRRLDHRDFGADGTPWASFYSDCQKDPSGTSTDPSCAQDQGTWMGGGGLTQAHADTVGRLLFTGKR